MDFEFNLGWMFGGLVITLIGGIIVILYRPIADNLVSGVSSYEKVKLFGVITIVFGLLMTTNLLSFLLTLIVKFLLGR